MLQTLSPLPDVAESDWESPLEEEDVDAVMEELAWPLQESDSEEEVSLEDADITSGDPGASKWHLFDGMSWHP